MHHTAWQKILLICFASQVHSSWMNSWFSNWCGSWIWRPALHSHHRLQFITDRQNTWDNGKHWHMSKIFLSCCVRMCNLSVHLFFVEFTFFNMLCCLNISPILLFISSRVQCLGEQPSDRPIPNATLQVTGAVGWRREGLVYKKNEVSCVLSYFHSLSLLPYYCRFTTLIHYRSSWILLRVWIFLCLQKVGHEFSLSSHWCLLDFLLIVMILGVAIPAKEEEIRGAFFKVTRWHEFKYNYWCCSQFSLQNIFFIC